jgi:hypothetical protein
VEDQYVIPSFFPRNASSLAPTIHPAQLPWVIFAARHKVNNLLLGHLSHHRRSPSDCALSLTVILSLVSTAIAMARILHWVGVFFLLASFVLLLVTTVTTPVVGDLAMMKVILTNATQIRHSSVTFGTFGHCILDVPPDK